jgi:hypothetical protein
VASSSLLGSRTRIDSQTVLTSKDTGRQTVSASLSSFDQSSTLLVTLEMLVWKHYSRDDYDVLSDNVFVAR